MSGSSKHFDYVRPILSHGDAAYLDMHQTRFRYTLDLVQQAGKSNPASPEPFRVLDVGQSVFTLLLRQEIKGVVNQLGFQDLFLQAQPRPGEQHFEFNLDTTVDRSKWIKVPPHDVVVAGEVVEHLYTSPNHWLPFFQSCLAPGGHLIISTPNGVALRRRLLLLAGMHPYELIHDDPHIAGHFREYTRKELVAYAAGHGLELVHFSGKAHLYYPVLPGRIYRWVTACLPSWLRDSMYFVFKNTGQPGKSGKYGI